MARCQQSYVCAWKYVRNCTCLYICEITKIKKVLLNVVLTYMMHNNINGTSYILEQWCPIFNQEKYHVHTKACWIIHKISVILIHRVFFITWHVGCRIAHICHNDLFSLAHDGFWRHWGQLLRHEFLFLAAVYKQTARSLDILESLQFKLSPGKCKDRHATNCIVKIYVIVIWI